MYAVIRDVSRQYRVEEGMVLDVDLRPSNPGDTIEFSDVLLVGGGGPIRMGTPTKDSIGGCPSGMAPVQSGWLSGSFVTTGTPSRIGAVTRLAATRSGKNPWSRISSCARP